MKQYEHEKSKLELEIQAKQSKIDSQESDMEKILSKFTLKKAIEIVIDARLCLHRKKKRLESVI